MEHQSTIGKVLPSQIDFYSFESRKRLENIFASGSENGICRLAVEVAPLNSCGFFNERILPLEQKVNLRVLQNHSRVRVGDPISWLDFWRIFPAASSYSLGIAACLIAKKLLIPAPGSDLFCSQNQAVPALRTVGN